MINLLSLSAWVCDLRRKPQLSLICLSTARRSFPVLHLQRSRSCWSCTLISTLQLLSRSISSYVDFPSPHLSALLPQRTLLSAANNIIAGDWSQYSIMASSLSDMSPEQLSAMASYPALAPPPGVLSNFTSDAPNQNAPFFVVTSLLLGIMGVFILNRFYAKTFLIRKYSWDDCMLKCDILGKTTDHLTSEQ